MLRVAMKGAEGASEVPVEDELSAESPEEAVDSSLPKLSQERVVYMGPESGPFRCDNCVYWSAPNACNLVDGDIDPGGICNLFVGSGMGVDATEPVEVEDPESEY